MMARMIDYVEISVKVGGEEEDATGIIWWAEAEKQLGLGGGCAANRRKWFWMTIVATNFCWDAKKEKNVVLCLATFVSVIQLGLS